MANFFETCNTDNDTDDDVVVNTMVNIRGLLTSKNEEILQHSFMSIIDSNTVLNNIKGDCLPSSEDDLIPSQVCHPVNSEVNTLFVLPNVDCLSEPADGQEINTKIDKLRRYLQTQCYEVSNSIIHSTLKQQWIYFFFLNGSYSICWKFFI